MPVKGTYTPPVSAGNIIVPTSQPSPTDPPTIWLDNETLMLWDGSQNLAIDFNKVNVTDAFGVDIFRAFDA